MKIVIETIPHKSQRYPTVGDWQFWADRIVINVSEMQNPDYEFCVALHEMIEAYLCARRGISEQAVTDFDVEFEKTRSIYNENEPGDHPDAPYKREHFFATTIERLVAQELGVDWIKYGETVDAL